MPLKGLDLLGALALNKAVKLVPAHPLAVRTTALTLPAPTHAAAALAPPSATHAATTALSAPTLSPSGAANTALTPPAGTTGTAAQALAPSAQSVSQASASANKLMSAAKALAAKRPKSALAKTAQQAASNSLARISHAKSGAASTTIKTTALRAAHAMLGLGNFNVALDPSQWLATQAGTDDAFTAMVQAAAGAYDVLDQLTTAGLQTLIDQGNSILNDMNSLLTNANATLDPTGTAYAGGAGAQFGSQAFALLQKENYWETAANQAMSGAGTAPGGTTAPGATSTPGATAPNALAPTIQSVVDTVTGTPNNGNPGDSVIITGTNFTGATAVAFGGVPATTFTVTAPTQITAIVPQGAPLGSVTVTNQYGTGTSSQAFNASFGGGAALDPGGGGGGGYYGGGDYGGGDYGGGDYGGSSDYGNSDYGAADQGTDWSPEDASNQEIATMDQTYNQGFAPVAPQANQAAVYDQNAAAAANRVNAAAAVMAKAIDWDAKAEYKPGDVVKHAGSYYRCIKHVRSRWILHNDAPADAPDQWSTDIIADQTTSTVVGLDWEEWAKTFFVSPVWSTIDLYNQNMNPGSRPVYQPRYVNPYWQTRAQSSPAMTATQQRLQLAQQLQAALQAQLNARYAQLQQPPATSPTVVGDNTMSKIPGPALCGFAPYFVGLAPVRTISPGGSGRTLPSGGGVSRPAAPTAIARPKGAVITVKRSPGGHPFSSVHINQKHLSKHDPAELQKNAAAVVKHLQTVSKNALASIARAEKAQKSAPKAPPPHQPARAVMGATIARRPVRPPMVHHVAPVSLSQLKTQAKDLQTTASKLADAAKGYKKKTDQAATKQKSIISKQKSVTKLHGYIGADAYGRVPGQPGYDPTTDPTAGYGAAQGTGPDAYGLYPGQPGYDPTTDPTSPSYGGGYAAGGAVSTGSAIPGTGPDANGLYPGQPGYNASSDPTSPSYAYGGTYGTGGTAVSQVPGPPDYGAGPTPTLDTAQPQPEIDYTPSSDISPDDWQEFYTSDPSGLLPDGSNATPVPIGAVYFDGSRPFPFRGVGNATCFYNILPGGATPKGGQGKPGEGSGYEWHGSGGFDWALVLQGSGGGYSGGKNYDKVKNPDIGMIAESEKNGWGPLIGNPQGGWTNGLRFDVAKMAFFWPYDQAPSWAQDPIKQAALNAAILAWQAAQAAGQADYVAAQLQDKLDAQTAQANARAQAQQDLQLGLQQQVFSQQQAQQQAQLDLQAQQAAMAQQQQQDQLDAQYAAADLAAQQQQAQMDQITLQMQQQQQAADIQAQQAATAYAQSQGLPPPGYQGGGDQGGGDQGGGGYVDPNDPYGLDAGANTDPEAPSDAEAAAIDAGQEYDTVMGAAGAAAVDAYLRRQRLRDEGAVDGAGNIIGLDDYGNLTE